MNITIFGQKVWRKFDEHLTNMYVHIHTYCWVSICFTFLLSYKFRIGFYRIRTSMTSFPNRSLLLRVLMGNQRGEYTERHTNRTVVRAAGRPGIAVAVLKFIEDSHKSPKKCTVLNVRKNFLWKNKWFFHLCVNQYTFENCIVLHKEVKNNTLLKTVLFYTRKSKTMVFQHFGAKTQ